ncbi:MAG: DUF4349 domain-containing protein [Defluviitaleaceae bacterium]|nr:DUF4349 domain-containing protein [Defluviitaleaceae bacterium]
MKKLLAVVLMVLIFSPFTAYAAYVRTLEISVRVECVERAAAIIAGLPGTNIHADANFTAHNRHASFSRRVDALNVNFVRMAVQGLGEVLHESAHARHILAELDDLAVLAAVNEDEIARLMSLMATMPDLDSILAIDWRLTMAQNERDHLRGRTNQLLGQADAPLIQISLWENPPEPFVYASAPFGTRLGEAFGDSARGFVRFFGNFAVVLAYISIPLVIFGIIGFFVYRGIKKYRKNRVIIDLDDIEIS